MADGSSTLPNNLAALRRSAALVEFVENVTTARRALSEMLDPRRDLDAECGYPAEVSLEQYWRLYKRDGICKRVVHCLPEESWRTSPDVFEDEDVEVTTEFEQAWQDLVKSRALWHYLERIDRLSGVGRYGVLLLGLSDGLPLDQPVAGVDLRAEGRAGGQPLELLYLKPLPESSVRVDLVEADTSSSRFAKPLFYQVTFEEASGGVASRRTARVHWSRCLHVADNREESDLYGAPRLEPIVDMGSDLKKVRGGSAEMFWKGGFPGLALELNPEMSDANVDTEKLRGALADYQNGLQRFIAPFGMTVKSLTPQVADPTGHASMLLDQIAMAVGVPKRILFGSERGELASSQDARAWNDRLMRRQREYLTPFLVQPLIERLVAVGALPEPKTLTISWPDLNTTTDTEKADLAQKRTAALAQYVQSGADVLIPPAEFLHLVLGFDQDTTRQVLAAAVEQQREEDRTERLPPPSPPPPPAPEGDEPEAPDAHGEVDEDEAPEDKPVGNADPVARLAGKLDTLTRELAKPRTVLELHDLRPTNVPPIILTPEINLTAEVAPSPAPGVTVLNEVKLPSAPAPAVIQPIFQVPAAPPPTVIVNPPAAAPPTVIVQSPPPRDVKIERDSQGRISGATTRPEHP